MLKVPCLAGTFTKGQHGATVRGFQPVQLRLLPGNFITQLLKSISRLVRIIAQPVHTIPGAVGIVSKVPKLCLHFVHVSGCVIDLGTQVVHRYGLSVIGGFSSQGFG